MIASIRKKIKYLAVLLLLLLTIAALPAQAEVVYFSDDFESGLGNWISSWALTETTSVSLTHSATDSPDVNYPPNSNSELTLKQPIDLSGTVSPVLTFWQKIFIGDSCGHDHGYLEISQDGGFNWAVLRDNTCTFQDTWNYVQIDLSSYKASPIKIRFRVRADGDGNISDGWYVDDVEIKEKDTMTLSFPFKDDFESGLGNWSVNGSDWALTDKTYFSPTHSVTDSPDVNYPPNSNAGLTLLHPIDLSGTVSPVLTFWQKIFIGDSCGHDHGYLEISQDGGFNWAVLRDNTCTFQDTWNYVPIDLGSYKASPIKIRFRVRADGDGNISDGWYIDDVEIWDLIPPPVSLTVSKSGNGYCTVKSTPPGINCGDDCIGNYSNGQIVTLNVALESGCVFAGWSGDCSACTGPECLVTMDMNKSCNATCNAAKCAGKDVTIVGTPGDDIIEGTEGPDVISGLGGNDIIIGFSGNDRICGGDGNDTLIDYGGKDRLYGDAGNDYLYGGNGDDTLNGGDGNDILDGVDGNDTLKGEVGKDTLMGGDGDDNLNGGSGFDFCDGGPHVIGDTAVSCETIYNVP